MEPYILKKTNSYSSNYYDRCQSHDSVGNEHGDDHGNEIFLLCLVVMLMVVMMVFLIW